MMSFVKDQASRPPDLLIEGSLALLRVRVEDVRVKLLVSVSPIKAN